MTEYTPKEDHDRILFVCNKTTVDKLHAFRHRLQSIKKMDFDERCAIAETIGNILMDDSEFYPMKPTEAIRFLSPTTAEVCGATEYNDLDQGLVDRKADAWVPACGGKERPQVYRTGRTLLYCWNPGTGQHRYLDTTTDIILSNDEAMEAMGEVPAGYRGGKDWPGGWNDPKSKLVTDR